MKKVFWVSLTVVICVLSVIWGCQKTVKDQKADSENATGDVASRAVPENGSSCKCSPGQISCQSSCWLSDCCICWNPTTSDGGCGCWLGVAMCKIESKKMDQAIYATQVRVFDQRMEEVFDKLDQLGEETGILRQKFKDIAGDAPFLRDSATKDSYKLVSGKRYLDFAQLYKEVTGRMSRRDFEQVKDFIESRRSGHVK